MSFAMEDEQFDVYDGPRFFVDLTNANEELEDATSVDEYFFQSCRKESYESEVTVQSSNTMYFSPSGSRIEQSSTEALPEITSTNTGMGRRSMSNGNLVMFSEQKGRVFHERSCKVIKEHLQSSEGLSKCKSNTTSKGSLDNLNKGAQPKPYGSFDNIKKMNQNKFVSMAEQISLFQNRTPQRFRVKPPIQTKQPLQRCKIKANPVNQKVLKGPGKALVPVEKKPTTVPVPFKLTEVPPKQTAPSPQKYVFHANPILKPSPKRTSAAATRPTTKPITPTFMKHYKPPMRCASASKEPNATANPDVNRPRMTKPEPFSFAFRDKLVAEKREKMIQKVLEEERRAREFHANPAPKAIYKPSSKRTSMDSINSTRKGSSKSSFEDLTTNFKAQPAKVLQQKPFVPAPSDKKPTMPEPFELESERRRLERLAYEEQQRKNMEKLRNLELQREEEKKAAEREEIAKIRKSAEIKARPVPNYKPMNIQPSDKKLTQPKSPKFHKNKENVPFNN